MRSVHYLSFVLLPALALTCVQTLVIAADDAQEANTTSQGAHRPSRNAIPADTPADIRKQIELTLSEDRQQRGAAVEALGKMGERAAASIPFLMPLLGDFEYFRSEYEIPFFGADQVRDATIWALTRIGKPSVEPCLAAIAKQSPNSEACFDVLGQLQDERAVPLILAGFQDEDERRREGAVKAACYWNNGRFIEPLLAATKDESSHVRYWANCGLGQINDPRVVAPLIEALTDEDGATRSNAIGALADHDAPAAIAFARRTLDDPQAEESFRRRCGLGLAQKGRPEDIEHLFELLNDLETSTYIRGGIAQGFAWSKNPRLAQRGFVDRLVATASDQRHHWHVRRFVIEGIQQLGGKESIPQLSKIARSKTDEIRVRCYAVLSVIRLTDGKIDDVDFVTIIERGFTPPQPGVYEPRDQAMRMVAKNGTIDIVREAAKARLRYWGRPEEVPAERRRRPSHGEK